MRIVLFCHSLLSDWNHGNAHFLRGLVTELSARGDDVIVYEPRDAWSVQNLVHDHGEAVLERTLAIYPRLTIRRYDDSLDLDAALDGADLVLVHEWNEPDLVAAIGARRRTGRFRALFHDTHHRAVSDPDAMGRYDLDGYDGVLAFGAAVARVYERRGWGARAFVFHEAADTRIFRPKPSDRHEGDVVWIGNWGDEERTNELRELFLDPVTELGLAARVYGVRYPAHALDELAARNIAYGGWLPNHDVPSVFARYTFTLHIPRRPYVQALPGIPTIRVFEALACGIPLISGRWDDVEGLFSSGDYLVAHDTREMVTLMRLLLRDASARKELAERGLATIRRRHTCGHRADELRSIAASLGVKTHSPRKDLHA
jgi:spore maturation protein CgeB